MARRLILFGLFVTFAAGSFAQPSLRILGGEDAPTNAYPFGASVRLDLVHICGGSIISNHHILTAAHCVVEKSTSVGVDPRRVSVRVGSTNQFAGGSLEKISHITVHPEYFNLKNDLAILTLERALVWTDRIQNIAYAKTSGDEPPVGEVVATAGWGEDLTGASPYKLQQTRLTVASEEVCTDAYSDNDDSIICLAHGEKQGTCRGDGGNGAIYRNTLVAVSNFVIGACGARYPDVYSNVAYFAEWIDSVLKE